VKDSKPINSTGFILEEAVRAFMFRLHVKKTFWQASKMHSVRSKRQRQCEGDRNQAPLPYKMLQAY